jgi:hypothetical protein
MKRPFPNQEFAKTNADFLACCTSAGVEPTKRQASKFRMRKGRAYLEWKRGVRARSETDNG